MNAITGRPFTIRKLKQEKLLFQFLKLNDLICYVELNPYKMNAITSRPFTIGRLEQQKRFLFQFLTLNVMIHYVALSQYEMLIFMSYRPFLLGPKNSILSIFNIESSAMKKLDMGMYSLSLK